MWWSVLSSLATGSPGLQLTMNHGSEAWHTPQVKGTSSLKSFRKRPLPSLPAKAEWRTKVFQWGEETAGLQDWPPPVVPEEFCQWVRMLQPCRVLFLGSINTLKTLQPNLTFASGLVFPGSVLAEEN